MIEKRVSIMLTTTVMIMMVITTPIPGKARTRHRATRIVWRNRDNACRKNERSLFILTSVLSKDISELCWSFSYVCYRMRTGQCFCLTDKEALGIYPILCSFGSTTLHATSSLFSFLII
ncbi:hypothetical protein [Phaffia rhodozyma]|uniref:Uncharacterized protein n=1 Tax=Phaffia rhodozyma TaxID=264483 RepID=A0A0F7SND0_PHARH|nr:hypothetical protein [Phaffia rhodozyma]